MKVKRFYRFLLVAIISFGLGFSTLLMIFTFLYLDALLKESIESLMATSVIAIACVGGIFMLMIFIGPSNTIMRWWGYKPILVKCPNCNEYGTFKNIKSPSIKYCPKCGAKVETLSDSLLDTKQFYESLRDQNDW